MKPSVLFVLPFFASAACAAEPDSIKPIDAQRCALLNEKGVISPSNPVGCDRLRAVTFQHVDFMGERAQGEVTVLDAVAPSVLEIFQELRQQRFPLNKALGIEHYEGSDAASMADNNTSAFNARAVTGGSRLSLHAYGVAIDLNPLQNPFISISTDGAAMIDPVAAARSYVNRLDYRPGKPERAGLAEPVVDVFARHGFINWGGYWNYPVDYQHFEIAPRSFVEQLAAVSPGQAALLFEGYKSEYRACLVEHYEGSPISQRAYCAERTMQKYAS